MRPPGLYTIVLKANYTAITLQTDYGVESVNGSFFGQVLVTGAASVPLIKVSPSTLYEGQRAQIAADIHYANGTETRFGEYSAFVYPQEASGLYKEVNLLDLELGYLVQLNYSSTLNRWVGSFTAPSPYNSANLSPITAYALYYSGPYDAFVTGHSYDGVPTGTDLSAQQAFFIQPYTLFANQTFNSLQQSSGLAFSGDTIAASANLSNDVFLGPNTIQGGTVTISDSSIQGTLNVNNAKLDLMGVSGGSIYASNSQLQLIDSSVGSLSLTGSNVSLGSSTYNSITPSLPTIQIQQPSGAPAYNGLLSINAAVNGQQVAQVTFSVDGNYVKTFTGGSTPYSYVLDTTKLADGAHTLMVMVLQQDGILSSASAAFDTDNQLVSAQSTINGLGTQLSSENASIKTQNDTINSLNSNLNSASNEISKQGITISSLTYGLYALAALTIVALAVGIVAMRRKPPAEATAGANPPAPAASDNDPKSSSSVEHV